MDGVVYGDGKSATPPFPTDLDPRGPGRAREWGGDESGNLGAPAAVPAVTYPS